MFRSNEALQAKTGLGFRAAEERAHVHFLGAETDAELTAALSPEELDSLLDEILAIKGDDRETWRAGIEYADACIKRKIRIIDRNLDALAENGSADSPALRESLALLREQEGRFSDRLSACIGNASAAGVPKGELDRLSGTLEPRRKIPPAGLGIDIDCELGIRRIDCADPAGRPVIGLLEPRSRDRSTEFLPEKPPRLARPHIRDRRRKEVDDQEREQADEA